MKTHHEKSSEVIISVLQHVEQHFRSGRDSVRKIMITIYRPFPPTFAIQREREKLRYWVGFFWRPIFTIENCLRNYWKLPSSFALIDDSLNSLARYDVAVSEYVPFNIFFYLI